MAYKTDRGQNPDVTEEKIGEYEIGFHSYDGGGPEYSVSLSDESVVHSYGYREYAKADHEMMTGAGFEEIFGFTGRKPGLTHATVTVSLFGDVRTASEFDLSVDEDLAVTRVNDEKYSRFRMLSFVYTDAGIANGFTVTASPDGHSASLLLEGSDD